MITEIGIAAPAMSPVIGLMISGEIRTKKDSYESAFRAGEKCGSELAMVTCNITINSLRRQNQGLSEELSLVRSQLVAEQAALIHARKSHPTAEDYMACMNWGSRRMGFSLVETIRRYERR